MDIEVEGSGDVGMSEDDADSLVVAVAFYAARGEAVAQPVEFQRRYAERFHQLHIVVSVGSRLYRLRFVAYHVVVAVDHLFQWTDHRHQGPADRYLACGVDRFWCVDDYLSMFRAVIFQQVDAFNSALHRKHRPVHFKIAPFQSADLADAQTCRQADVNAEITECEILRNIIKDLAVVCGRQHFYGLFFGRRRIFYVPFGVLEISMLLAEAHYHFQHDKDILDILLAQTGVKSVDDKRLHFWLVHGMKVSECRDDLVFYDQCIG